MKTEIAIADHPSRTILRTVGVANVHCSICAATLEMVVRELPGVSRATVDLLSGAVRVRFDPRVTSEAELLDALASGGFEVGRDAV